MAIPVQPKESWATKPDYRVCARDRATGKGSRVGAAWKCKGDRISVHLDPFVVLDGRQDLQITLFPIDEPEDAQ